MTLSEKSAYLKGLMDGLKLDTDKNEGKLIAAIIDMLSDVAENVADLEDVVDCISDELDCIEEDLDNIDEYLLDDEDDEDEDDEDYEDDFGDEDEFDFGDETLYEVKCPTCGEVITIDEEMLDEGSTKCPNCHFSQKRSPSPKRGLIFRRTSLVPVGADASVRPFDSFAPHPVGADAERSCSRRRSVTDAACPLRVLIGPFPPQRIASLV